MNQPAETRAMQQIGFCCKKAASHTAAQEAIRYKCATAAESY